MSWWEYASGVEKALVIIGIASLVILAVVVASPHVKPLQPIANALGLVRTETVCGPVTSETVQVSLGEAWWNMTGYFFGDGWVWGRIVVLPNGTAWFVGVWVIPDSLATNLISGVFARNYTMPYGVAHTYSTDIPATFFINGSKYRVGFPSYLVFFVSRDNFTLNYPFPGYSMAIFGDVAGPVVFKYDNLTLSGDEVTIITPALYIPGYGPLTTNGGVYGEVTLALNRTYYGYLYMSNETIIPFRLDVIYVPNPQAALGLEVPFARYVASVTTYMNYGVTWNEESPYFETFGWWVYRLEVAPTGYG